MKPKRIMCGGRTSVQLALKPMVVMYLSSDGDADRARIYTAAPPPPARSRHAAVAAAAGAPPPPRRRPSISLGIN